MYNKVVEDCFFAPRHVGVLDETIPFVVHYRSAQQNDTAVIDFYIQCNEHKKIIKAFFKTNGNPYLIAAMEWLCRSIEEKSLDEVSAFNYQVLIRELEIPLNQYPIALQVEGVLKQGLALMNKQFVTSQ